MCSITNSTFTPAKRYAVFLPAIYFVSLVVRINPPCVHSCLRGPYCFPHGAAAMHHLATRCTQEVVVCNQRELLHAQASPRVMQELLLTQCTQSCCRMT